MIATLFKAEQARLAAIRSLKILDTPTEPIFDLITMQASNICKMPIALMTIIDDDRQWFKANVGLRQLKETDRTTAFCNFTILSYELLMIPDASLDERFIDNILVTNSPKIRFYAGAPIMLDSGEKIGTLCVLDVKPNSINTIQRNTLIGLASIISNLLDTRRELLVKKSQQLKN